MWAAIGYSQGDTSGNPYFLQMSNEPDYSYAANIYDREQLDEMTDKGAVWYEYSNGSELSNFLSSLNAPYFKGTNAQTQDRGYANPDNPEDSIFIPDVEQVQEKLDDGYSPSAIANLITNREFHILPYVDSDSNAIREENTTENGGIGILLLAAAFLLRK